MPDPIALQVISKREVAGGSLAAAWEDPEGLARPSPRVRRMLLTNPLSTSDDDPVQIVALRGRRVVGRASVFAGRLHVAGEAVPMLWGGDLRVSAEHRRQGIGAMLAAHRATLHETVAVCGLVPASRALYRELGWLEFAMPTYFLVARSRKFLRHYVRSTVTAAALAPLADAGLDVVRGLPTWRRRQRTRNWGTEITQTLSPEYDPLILRQDVPVVSHRSAEWMNWMLSLPEPEERQQQRLCYVRNRRGEAVAYFVLRRRPLAEFSGRFRDVVLGSVKDWTVFDEGQVNTLSVLLVATRELLAWGADVVAVSVPGAGVGEQLRHFGFRRRGELAMVVRAHPPSPLAYDEFREQHNWRITPAEGDHLFS